MPSVSEYLDRASRTPWAWGGGADGWSGHDCTLFAANWVSALTGRDPAADLRGTYSTREEAEAILSRTGLVPLMLVRLVPAGWRRPDAVADGDVGVVAVPLGRGQHWHALAIFAAGHWVTADPRRLVALPADLHATTLRAPA